MKVKVFEEYFPDELEGKVNAFLSIISNEQVKHIKMSCSEGRTTIVIFYTER